jgi:hypothetical protein
MPTLNCTAQIFQGLYFPKPNIGILAAADHILNSLSDIFSDIKSSDCVHVTKKTEFILEYLGICITLLVRDPWDQVYMDIYIIPTDCQHQMFITMLGQKHGLLKILTK